MENTVPVIRDQRISGVARWNVSADTSLIGRFGITEKMVLHNTHINVIVRFAPGRLQQDREKGYPPKEYAMFLWFQLGSLV
jgi:hypothetical protein